jgi:protein gp37
MGETTAISWCDHTKNLWWGCWKIDPECANCYADELANRYAAGLWGRTKPRKFFDDKNLNELLKWNRAARKAETKRRVFVGSMMDWAEIHPVAEINDRMNERRRAFWNLVPQCDALDFLMLTKRPENAPLLIPSGPPLPNVWQGVTAGTIDTLVRKVPLLRRVPAAVRFISCEPLLEGIPSQEWDDALKHGDIHWLIVGDESGHKRRDANLDWVRLARDAAVRHGVRFHFKQWNTDQPKKVHLPMLDSQQWAEFPASKP